eukprot:COSAG05_NODE_7933_length_754_cov_1.254962_1_plen_113_part_10
MVSLRTIATRLKSEGWGALDSVSRDLDSATKVTLTVVGALGVTVICYKIATIVVALVRKGRWSDASTSTPWGEEEGDAIETPPILSPSHLTGSALPPPAVAGTAGGLIGGDRA